MKQIELKANEPYTWTASKSAKLTVYCDAPCSVLHNGKPTTPLPGAVNMAVHMFRVRAGDEVDLVPISTVGVSVSIVEQATASPFDPVDPNSLVETLAPEEMSLYDKLRGELLGYMSQLAEKNGLETVDEADDLDLDDEDDPLIDTPYEYEAMVDEYVQEPNPEPTPSTGSASEETSSESETRTDVLENDDSPSES